MPFFKMKTISCIGSQLSSSQSFDCYVCPLAKQSRLPFPDSSIKSTRLFQLIHVDTWDHTILLPDGSKFFLTIVDDYTKSTWTHLLGAKSNAFTLLKAFLALVETQFHTKVQTVRSDNALELGSSSSGSQFFYSLGIIHQTSCPHTPQQNGIVERKHVHLLDTARALLFHSRLPIRFWRDCILTATYLINRFPSPLLHHQSPYEILYGSSPSYDHLRAFGCLCYSTIPKPHRHKFDRKAFL